MAEETTITPTPTPEFITDKHLKKYMIAVSHVVISSGILMYCYKMYSSPSADFIVKFDGMVFFWYAISTLLLTFPAIAIDVINAFKGK